MVPFLSLCDSEAQQTEGDPVVTSQDAGDGPKITCELSEDCCCPNGQDKSAKSLIILIHGVNPSGQEFDKSEEILGASHCIETKRFSYDDDACSDDITTKLKKFVSATRGKEDKYCKVILLGHSAGGIMASKLAADPEASPLEVHTAATPLKGGGHGWPAWIARPFIGCLKAEIGAGPGSFKPAAPGSNVTHHKTKDEDDGVLGAGYQNGNDVPGSTSTTHPGYCHQCILSHVAEIIKPDCPENEASICVLRH